MTRVWLTRLGDCMAFGGIHGWRAVYMGRRGNAALPPQLKLMVIDCTLLCFYVLKRYGL
jgi:hypothetical protein